MKKRLLLIVLIIFNFQFSIFNLLAAEVKPLQQQKWGHICQGRLPEEWYASDEARSIAEVVMAVQKSNGGWMKNDQLHKLTEEQMLSLLQKKREHSCLDNYATTQEMRYLAHVTRTSVTGNPFCAD